MSKTLVRDGTLAIAVAVGGGLTSLVSAQSLQNAPAGVQPLHGVHRTGAPRLSPNGTGQVLEAAGVSVLHYEEFTLGVSAYTDALNALGATVTFTADPFVFESELQTGAYGAVIAAHQNSFGLSVWEDDLVNWVGANPGSPVLISDWRVNNPDVYPYLAALGFAYDLSVNPFEAVPVPGGVFDGLGVAPLASPGWGIYAYGTSGGVTEATTELGGPFVSRNGSVFFNGFLSDVFLDAGQGMEWVLAELAPSGCPDCGGLRPGNRVTLISDDTGHPELVAGRGGTVLGYNPDFPEFIAIRWDNFHSGHCYGGPCGAGAPIVCPAPEIVFDASGWWVLCDQVRVDYDCPGDVNNDNQIDVSDLLEVLGNWGFPCGAAGVACDFPFVCGEEAFFCEGAEDCICFMAPDGSGVCAGIAVCAGLELCFGGQSDCPPGTVCTINTCCEDPVCSPECGFASPIPPGTKPGAQMNFGVYDPDA